MRKSIAWDITAIVVAVLMTSPVLMGLVAASFDLGGRQIEIREFKKQEHLERLISAFHLDLAPNETFYVERYRRGVMQAPPVLSIAIEGIESVDDFISRYSIVYNELDLSEDSYFFEARYHRDAFRVCMVDLYDFGHELGFYETESGIIAVLDVRPTLLRSLVDVRSILAEYFHSMWLHPFFLVPLAIQAGLVIFVVVRVIRRIIHKIRNKKRLNEG